MSINQNKRVAVSSYGTTPQSVCNPDGSFIGGTASNDVYDNAEFTLATGLSDYDANAGVANAFSNITTARYTEIRTDQTITVKLNSTSNHSITITSSDSPYMIDNLEITNVYITNASGSTANIKIRLS